MTLRQLPWAARAQLARDVVAGLYANFDATVSAVVADGWPEPMVRAGFAMHRRTWDIDALIEQLDRELHGMGGLRALDQAVTGPQTRARLIAPQRVLHVWPALPGSGLTPALLGMILGAEQRIRPSGRGAYFATHLLKLWEQIAGENAIALEAGAPGPTWRDMDVIVASGRDDTVQAIRDYVGTTGHRGRPLLMGYGHRVSLAAIINDPHDDALRHVDNLALDIVMWHQRGCFSPLAVIFCGDHGAMIRFCEALGDAIAKRERQLGATVIQDEALLGRRAQARGLAELSGARYGEGLGWAQPSGTPFEGQAVAPHVVTVHRVGSLDTLNMALRVPPHQLQGCALGTPDDSPLLRAAWQEALAARGFTCVTRPGLLQSPPPGWFHDGWPNVMDWMRVCVFDD